VLLNFRKLLRSQLTRHTGGCPDTVTGEATAAERRGSPAKERRPSGEKTAIAGKVKDPSSEGKKKKKKKGFSFCRRRRQQGKLPERRA
jgi:hypothetical protein